MKTYIFHREDGFYPIELEDDNDAIANAEFNQGTVKVTTMGPDKKEEVVWEKSGGLIVRSSWQSFRETGLLLFVNSFLQIFGWSIVVEYGETNRVKEVYPAKTKLRGFNEESCNDAYKKITNYMANNISDIKKAVED